MEIIFELRVTKIIVDDESEFENTRIDELCDEIGIKHQFLAKYTL
jgi:hypothetical protein